MKQVSYKYVDLPWSKVEKLLKKHRLTRANIKRFRWASEPTVEIIENSRLDGWTRDSRGRIVRTDEKVFYTVIIQQLVSV